MGKISYQGRNTRVEAMKDITPHNQKDRLAVILSDLIVGWRACWAAKVHCG